MSKTRRSPTTKRARRRPVDAPGEFAFSGPDTPKPGDVAPDGRVVGPGLAVRVWGAAKLAFGTAVVLAAGLAIAWGAHRFALTTPRFAIKEFSVEGNRRSSDDRVVRAAGLERGANVFAVDLDAAEQKLLEDPWVRAVRITRRLPGTLEIELSERQPGALALLDGALYVLDVDGVPFKPLGEDDPHDLPVVTGLSPSGLALDRERELDLARHALEVLRVYETMPLSRVYPPEEVHLQPEGSTVLTVGREGIALRLGRTDWRRKLVMAARVIGKLQSKGATPGVVFLDNEAHEERVVVRMR